MLAASVTHLLPESIEHLQDVRKASLLFLIGLLGSFFLERMLLISFRRLHPPELLENNKQQNQHFHHVNESDQKSGRPIVANILLSGAVHSFFDGVSIAVAFAVGHRAGIATTVAVFLHEVPHHIADVGVLVYSGLTRRRAILLNLLATCGCGAGGILVLVFGLRSAAFTYSLLPVTAGNFLYIGLSILVPELQREQNDRRALIQVAGFITAALVMTTLSYWKPG